MNLIDAKLVSNCYSGPKLKQHNRDVETHHGDVDMILNKFSEVSMLSVKNIDSFFSQKPRVGMTLGKG